MNAAERSKRYREMKKAREMRAAAGVEDLPQEAIDEAVAGSIPETVEVVTVADVDRIAGEVVRESLKTFGITDSTPRHEAGFKDARRNLEAGGFRVVYVAKEQGIDVGDEKYATVCQAHGTIIGSKSWDLAKASALSGDFCSRCVELKAAGTVYQSPAKVRKAQLKADRAATGRRPSRKPSAANVLRLLQAGGAERREYVSKRYSPAWIVALRARLGVTQGGLARQLNVTPWAVMKWEQGKVRQIQLAHRIALLALEQELDEPKGGSTPEG